MRHAAALFIVVLVAFPPLASVHAQSPTPAISPRFEVASLKLAEPAMSYEMQWGRNTWSSSGPKRLSNLIGMAFDTEHMAGLPDWNNAEYYEVNAKAEDGVLITRETLRPRLRQLLIERFKLVTHVETAYFDGYALVLAKGGPKMKATEKPLAMTSLGAGRVRAPSISMDYLAKALSQAMVPLIGEPVVNETGLTLNYDFTMTFAPVDSVDSPLPSIFTALEDQLGLKLERRRRLPVETVVVDHVEHPTAD